MKFANKKRTGVLRYTIEKFLTENMKNLTALWPFNTKEEKQLQEKKQFSFLLDVYKKKMHLNKVPFNRCARAV